MVAFLSFLAFLWKSRPICANLTDVTQSDSLESIES